MAKLAINLLQPELLPKRQLITLSRVVALWCLLLVLMLLLIVYSQVTVDNLSRDYRQASEKQVEQQQLLDSLQQQVSQNRANPELIERLDTLKVVLANKKALHQQLTDQSQTQAAGYSAAMTELASLHHKHVSLEQVIMNKGQLTFSGLAKRPDAVPQWLAGFESSTFLSGKHFTHFSLSENKQGLTNFVVSSAANNAEKGPN
ncbi:PilN domain-containing protein [Thalassotalea piscium]|uniref:Tfp pilus assembly protein PilN n=1 Tax=Thalassotalea piscium TaxID=1230533 RepID=A0A7X0TUV9_9GAMM|nr:PilN domain-containing protein [Thalassotalea piscium]MBB6544618.1 Tfp pilus assembly protein PilN [Thalassotalea piscium]